VAVVILSVSASDPYRPRSSWGTKISAPTLIATLSPDAVVPAAVAKRTFLTKLIVILVVVVVVP